jgi:DNA-binding NtrC family response regulator
LGFEIALILAVRHTAAGASGRRQTQRASRRLVRENTRKVRQPSKANLRIFQTSSARHEGILDVAGANVRGARKILSLTNRGIGFARMLCMHLDSNPKPMKPKSDPSSEWPTLDVLRLRYIHRAIEHTNNNKTRAAELLGIDRRTLNRILARERARRRSVEATH